MSKLETRAEIARLAALLRVSEAHLAFIAHHDLETLRSLRDQVTDRLFDADRNVLEAIAKANSMVPGSVSSKIAVKAFPPSLAARVAGVLGTDKAIDMARRVPVTYLADLAPHLDPRRVTAILEKLPTQLLVDAGKILGERGEYIAMADFVGVLDDDQIARVIPVLSDEALVRTGLVIEDPRRIAAILTMLPPDRLAGVVTTAARVGQWDGIRRAIEHFDSDTRDALVDVARDLDGVPDDVLAVFS
ncbi:hypothetical protein [Nocardioides cavernaquae]|uniref:Uncharacterized protein n=1 Tax=Nocardioides cavernaquae TaxID=2321396 RepID=A0A3A5H9H1_9ACTN|nr:hypothetical protein [Nocardioides cavernaquae]RJS46035.1 hypothetical protein D4739_07245 [Nocardioides cavernaquae]